VTVSRAEGPRSMDAPCVAEEPRVTTGPRTAARACIAEEACIVLPGRLRSPPAQAQVLS
jgi:hypothetical protein